ncbi:MAG: EamA family transporter [Planctomycetaceae bacterium]
MTSTSPALLPGLVAGLAAAACSAVCYLITRHHGNRTGGGSLRLLVLGHVIMGLICLPIVWAIRPVTLAAPIRWLPPLLGSTACYLAGQGIVFATLKRMPASRLAPLLGLKIVMLAGIVSLLPGEALDPIQWLAVGASVAAAAMLQRTGGGGPPAAAAAVLAACLMFALADLCIVQLIDALHAGGTDWWPQVERLHAGCFAMAITYVLCGLLVALLLPWALPRDRRDWTAAGQYAVAWLAGMAGLYICFGLVGAVFGNILQSTRGIIAVGLGAVLAHLGWHDLEEQVDRATLLRRLAAAVLMTAAIALYVIDVG